jgi:hypothetical protein
MNSLTPGSSRRHALTVSLLTSVCQLERVLLRHQKTSAGLGHGYFITHHMHAVPIFSQRHCAHRYLQAENHVTENGEEPIYRHTMVGRILKIAVTKTRREYVIMEDFNILESRDHRYGMPTMQANPEQRYQVVPPAVSHQ